MMQVNLRNPIEVRNAGFIALKDALGPVGMVEFIQQFDLGFGDYTKEKYETEDLSMEDAANMMMAYNKSESKDRA